MSYSLKPELPLYSKIFKIGGILKWYSAILATNLDCFSCCSFTIFPFLVQCAAACCWPKNDVLSSSICCVSSVQILSRIFLSRLNFLFRIGGRERERLDDDHNNFCQPFQVVMLKFDVLCSRCW